MNELCKNCGHQDWQHKNGYGIANVCEVVGCACLQYTPASPRTEECGYPIHAGILWCAEKKPCQWHKDMSPAAPYSKTTSSPQPPEAPLGWVDEFVNSFVADNVLDCIPEKNWEEMNDEVINFFNRKLSQAIQAERSRIRDVVKNAVGAPLEDGSDETFLKSEILSLLDPHDQN